MSFESDLHRTVVATWFAQLVGRSLGLSFLTALVVVIGFAAIGADVGTAMSAGTLAAFFAVTLLWVGASAPVPNPDLYGDDEEV